MDDMQNQLNKYYKKARISPVKNTGNFDDMFDEFGCPMKKDCQAAAKEDCRAVAALNGVESFIFAPRTEGVNVSEYYVAGEYKGDRIPRIVVISLSAPRPDISTTKNETRSQTKKTVRNYHWPETLMTIRSLLCPFIAPEKFPEPELIEKLFVHLRTAKCCSNAKGGTQEPGRVYKNCGKYLGEEVRILEPDIIVTQGNHAHWQAEKHVFDKNAANIAVEEVEGIGDSIARIVNLKEDNRSVYWLRTIFPTHLYGHMKRWHGQAGPIIKNDSNLKGIMRKNIVRYGEEILRQWLSESDWENWDRQIEADSESGKLDFLIAEVLEAKEKGTLKEL